MRQATSTAAKSLTVYYSVKAFIIMIFDIANTYNRLICDGILIFANFHSKSPPRLRQPVAATAAVVRMKAQHGAARHH